jgi:PAS domain-containing protein
MPEGQDVQKLVHNLQVHQVELEMQNNELRRARQELEEARDRFVDLYDFAPLPLLTLSQDGEVLEANLAAARLLGLERKALIHRKFSRFFPAETQDAFTLYCR